MTQLVDAPLVSCDERRIIRVDDPIQKLAFVLLDPRQLGLEQFGGGLCRLGTTVPEIADHGVEHLERSRFRLQLREQGFKFPFENVAADRLAIGGTAFALTEIISVSLPVSGGGPATHQRLAANAVDKSAKRKIHIQVFARWHFRAARYAILDALEGFIADERHMLAGHQMQIPFRHCHITGVHRPRHHLPNAFARQVAAQLFRIFRTAGKPALNLALGFKSSEGISFKRFCNDAGDRFVAHQHLALAFDLHMLVADRRAQTPEAREGSGAHPVFGLDRVIAAMLAGESGFDNLVDIVLWIILIDFRRRFEATGYPRNRITNG